MIRANWPCFVVVALSVSRLPAAEPTEVSPPDRSVIAVTHVSDDFHRQVQLASQTIPDQVWDEVKQSGWRVRVAEFVVDAAPSLRNVRPRGWPSNATWNNSDAVHLPKAKLLVLAEKRRTMGGRVVHSNRVPGVLRHEFGHAFDIALGGPYGARSATPEFIRQYRLDVEALSDAQRTKMRYYLQDELAGRQETFAEAFAILLGGGSDTTRKTLFSAAFPGVTRFVQQAIETAEPPTTGR